MNPASTQELSIVRTIHAPRARVFEAFVKPELVAAWYGPRGFTVPGVEVDVRTGGRYRITMRARSGESYVVAGEYRAVEPPARIVFTWAWQGGPMAALGETLVTVTLEERAGATEVKLVHSGFPTQSARDSHNDGWSQCLNKLIEAVDERKSAATLTVYGVPASSYVRSVLFALGEKNLAFTLEPHTPHSPAQLERHAFGKVPAFSDGDFTLYETSAILRYIDESFEGPSLLAANPRQRARVEQWVSAIHAYLYPAAVEDYVLQYVIPRGPNGTPDRAAIERGIARSRRALAVFEQGYGAGEFLVGGALSIADITLAPIVAGVAAMPEGAAILEATPKLRAAHHAIAQRPSFQAAQRAAAR